MKLIKDFKYITFGITNQCQDNFLLPFFDYDLKDLFSIIFELSKLQIKFRLSNIYIIKSTNGYNAFSLDKLYFNELREIYNDTKLVDVEFIKWGINRGFMTLRMGKDKKCTKVLYSFSLKYKKSNAHKKFFNEIMNFNIKDNIGFDTEKKITFSCFPSNKYGILKEVFKNDKYLECDV